MATGERRMELDASGLTAALAALPAALDRRVLEAFTRVAKVIERNAKQTQLFRDRTGTLRRSIQAQAPKGSFIDGTLEVNVIAGGRRVRYAAFVHEGTQAHTIRARRKKSLAFPNPGGTGLMFRRSVRHPGTAPRPFMQEALDRSENAIEQTMENAVLAAFIDAGFEG